MSENEINKLQKEIDIYTEPNIGDKFLELVSETDFNIKRDFINKYVDHIKIFSVTSHDIDFTQFEIFELIEGSNKLKVRRFRNPHGNDKLIYVELFTYMSNKPIKAVMSSSTKINHVSNDLNYHKGDLRIF